MYKTNNVGSYIDHTRFEIPGLDLSQRTHICRKGWYDFRY